jgi:hypothetical protein
MTDPVVAQIVKNHYGDDEAPETEALRQRVAELEQLLKVMERQYAEALLYRKGD